MQTKQLAPQNARLPELPGLGGVCHHGRHINVNMISLTNETQDLCGMTTKT